MSRFGGNVGIPAVIFFIFSLALTSMQSAADPLVEAVTEAPLKNEVTQVAPVGQDDISGADTTSLSPTPIFKQSDFDMGDTIGDAVLYMAILCMIAAAVVYLVKRRLVTSGVVPEKLGTHIRLLDRKTLSTRTTLHLVEVDGVRVMVSDSNTGQTMIELTDEMEQSEI